ncbi:MAG: HAMP domain-containing histidine kinase [Bacteroidaceae bacterium]|nr:HAMP domain-containing histidine kinase [Bacteroidaceae bacterium]
MSNLGSSLSVINFEKFGETKGKVFTADNFAKDWDSIYVIPSELSDGIVNDKAFHKVDRKALVLDKKNPRMAYVMANQENPVFVPAARFEKIAEGKYAPKGFLVFFLDFSIMLPEFVFFLCRQGFWEKLLKSRDYSSYFNIWPHRDGSIIDDTMEDCFLSEMDDYYSVSLRYEIPSVSQQRERIAEFRAEEKYLDEIVASKERKMLKKTSSDLNHMMGTPYIHINNALELLSQDVDDKGKSQIKYIRDNFGYIKRLIEMNGANFNDYPKAMVNIVDFMERYIHGWENYGSKTFSIEFYCDGDFEVENTILANETALAIMMDCLLDNANRHGFHKMSSPDNKVKIHLDQTTLGNKHAVIIAVGNNGKPMPKDFSIDDYITSGKFGIDTGRSGLGGSHVYKIVSSMDGTLDFISEAVSSEEKDEWWTTFMITVPLVL